MTEQKTVVLKVRVTPDQADRWRKASVKAGAKDLSTFIRDLVEEEIQWEPVSQEEMLEAQRALNDALTQTLESPPRLKGFLGEVTQPVECGPETPEVAGSIPALPMRGGAAAAQGPHKPKDEGSSPSPAIAEVAKLADAPDSSPGSLGSEGSTPSLGTITAAIPDGVVCPRKFTHRAGVYCTACGFTPE